MLSSKYGTTINITAIIAVSFHKGSYLFMPYLIFFPATFSGSLKYLRLFVFSIASERSLSNSSHILCSFPFFTGVTITLNLNFSLNASYFITAVSPTCCGLLILLPYTFPCSDIIFSSSENHDTTNILPLTFFIRYRFLQTLSEDLFFPR